MSWSNYSGGPVKVNLYFNQVKNLNKKMQMLDDLTRDGVPTEERARGFFFLKVLDCMKLYSFSCYEGEEGE